MKIISMKIIINVFIGKHTFGPINPNRGTRGLIFCLKLLRHSENKRRDGATKQSFPYVFFFSLDTKHCDTGSKTLEKVSLVVPIGPVRIVNRMDL